MLTVRNPTTFDWKNIGLKDCLEGNAFDAYFTYKLYRLFESKLGDKLLRLHKYLISPALEEFYRIEYEGMEIDSKELVNIDRDLKNQLNEIEDELFEASQVRPSYNIRSGPNIESILYTDEDGFLLYPPDRTAKGAPSTSKDTIKLMLQQIETELVRREK